eukprot:6741191-Prymnesium_polylepis.1
MAAAQSLLVALLEASTLSGACSAPTSVPGCTAAPATSPAQQAARAILESMNGSFNIRTRQGGCGQ